MHQARYRDCEVDAGEARALAAICVAGVMAVWAACMAVCAGLALFGPAGFIATVACVGICVAEQAIGLSACAAAAAVSMRAARQRLINALEDCGVIIA